MAPATWEYRVTRVIVSPVTILLVLLGWSIYSVYSSFLPSYLDQGDFPPNFHETLETAMAAKLPRSLEFTQGLLTHGAGDIGVWVVARIPHADVQSLRMQFDEEVETSRKPYRAFLPIRLKGRKSYEVEVEFLGSFKWGSCFILHAIDGWHEVVFETWNKQKGQDADALWAAFP